jgi:hypothetical protein
MKTLEEQQEDLRSLLSTFNMHLRLPERRETRRTGVVTYKGQTCWMESRDKLKAVIQLPDFSIQIVNVSDLEL